jgi:PAS domain S-box-containing protein
MSESADTIHILHVDDEPDFAEMAATFLERENGRLNVQTATNPTEGLDILADHDVDCIVSDYDMPRTNGIEFLETVRETYPDLPFILYTGKGSEEIAADAISAGVTDYLQKEGGTDQYTVLANRVVNAVERYRAEREAEHTRTQLEAISENSADAILIIDADSRIRFANPAVEDHFGYTASELQGERLTTIMPARHREQHLAGIEKYLQTGERSVNWSNVEFSGLHKDGTEVPVSVSYSEFKQDGEPRFLGIIRDISERTQLEAELREREERFRQLAENIREVVWMSDPEKEEVLYVNPAYEEIWGQSTASLYENPTAFLDAVHPDDRERVETTLDTQASGEYDEEYRIVRPDGERRWIRDRAIPVKNDAGEVYRIVGVASDITERKERERELRRIKRAIDEAPVGITLTDPAQDDNPLIYVNDRFEKLTGYAEDEILGENCRLLQGEATDPEPVARIREAIDNQERVSVELRNYRKDGTEFWNEVSIAPVRDEDGSLVNYVGFQQNVSDQRRRERVLRDMYDIISDRHQSFEEQVQALLDLGRAELNTEYGTLSEIRGDEYIFKVVATDDDSIQAGDTVPVSATNCELVASAEETLVLGDIERDAPEQTDRAGFTEWGISCYLGAPVFIDGDVYGTFCFYDTESRSDQFSEWEVTLVDLMSRWASYELQRRQANEQLRQTNEQLEEFSSVVSHDLRNPLNVAEGRLELATEECDSEHLDAIGDALDRMDGLISDLLVLAREGNSATEIVPVRLATISENCWRNVDTADATLVADVDRTIRADESRLQQLFENLIRNAVEHGGDDVTVTVGELDDGFYIEDDGPGIPPDERDDVFDAGYSTQAEGTGFGLRIVEQIVNAHNWEINVTEGTEGGARFEITEVEFVAE